MSLGLALIWVWLAFGLSGGLALGVMTREWPLFGVMAAPAAGPFGLVVALIYGTKPSAPEVKEDQ